MSSRQLSLAILGCFCFVYETNDANITPPLIVSRFPIQCAYILLGAVGWISSPLKWQTQARDHIPSDPAAIYFSSSTTICRALNAMSWQFDGVDSRMNEFAFVYVISGLKLWYLRVCVCVCFVCGPACGHSHGLKLRNDVFAALWRSRAQFSHFQMRQRRRQTTGIIFDGCDDRNMCVCVFVCMWSSPASHYISHSTLSIIPFITRCAAWCRRRTRAEASLVAGQYSDSRTECASIAYLRQQTSAGEQTESHKTTIIKQRHEAIMQFNIHCGTQNGILHLNCINSKPSHNIQHTQSETRRLSFHSSVKNKH